ncbi:MULTISPECIES: hypothetical protein [Leucobacter]|uniref:hypothetical protein n=1 Tax=Leucobacter TaxID=55968 RepID=UPI000E65B4B0|nr:hypothetical protein [Leucobacter aridicollis]UTX54356.1 hypothetical protein KI794_06580 [Leucobacter aridicollis]
MKFPEVLKQPSTFVAAALVTACLVALLAAIGGFLLIDGATRTALSMKPVGSGIVASSSGENSGSETSQPAPERDSAAAAGGSIVAARG